MSQTHEEHVASFKQGYEHAGRKFFVDLYQQSDKRTFLKALSAKIIEEMADPNCSSEKMNQLKGMAHGLRVARLILDNLGDPVSAYKNIINPTLIIEFTVDDMQKG